MADLFDLILAYLAYFAGVGAALLLIEDRGLALAALSLLTLLWLIARMVILIEHKYNAK